MKGDRNIANCSERSSFLTSFDKATNTRTTEQKGLSRRLCHDSMSVFHLEENNTVCLSFFPKSHLWCWSNTWQANITMIKEHQSSLWVSQPSRLPRIRSEIFPFPYPHDFFSASWSPTVWKHEEKSSLCASFHIRSGLVPHGSLERGGPGRKMVHVPAITHNPTLPSPFTRKYCRLVRENKLRPWWVEGQPQGKTGSRISHW